MSVIEIEPEFEFIRQAGQTGDPSLVGGKAAALDRLVQAGFRVPPYFVVTAVSLDAELNPELQALPAGLESVRDDAEFKFDPNHPLTRELRIGVQTLLVDASRKVSPAGDQDESALLLAVRSSAREEDSSAHSLAGQLESVLAVRPDRVTEAVIRVGRSAFGERARAYRKRRGLTGTCSAPGVIVQRMLRPSASGVAFGADPVSGSRTMVVVSAVHGHSAALVGGEVDAETWRVARDGSMVERIPVRQRQQYVVDSDDPSGLRCERILEPLVDRPVLDEVTVRTIIAEVHRAGRLFGRPQDVEWAIEDGALYLVQSRPVTTLHSRPDPEGQRRIWDNSNIIESYNGVTTPLTFSFARGVYEEVYRQFCRLLRVPRDRVDSANEVFANMLGLMRGRVYYNLLNWYHVLAMLPGYRLNRSFMEQMMGVRESLAQDAGAGSPATGWRRTVDGWHVVRMALGLVWEHRRLPARVRSFRRRLDEALAPPPIPIDDMRIDELVDHYRRLQEQLLTRWDAPLVNDFFAMIFHGALRRLVDQWCSSDLKPSCDDLLRQSGDMISAEPARLLRKMADLAVAGGVDAVLRDGSASQAQAAVAAHGPLAAAWNDYLARFGERCCDELKLESPTLHDDPVPLLRAVGRIAAIPFPSPRASDRQPPPGAFEQSLNRAIGRRFLRRRILYWVLRHARRRIFDRETLRLERTRVFGRVRRIFLELGRRFTAEHLLDDARDVFYLEVHEVLDIVGGAASTSDLRGLARLRRDEYHRYRADEAPADRFETRGAPILGNRLTAAPDHSTGVGTELRGLGCSPGVARGPARVVVDPRETVLKGGEILVTTRTDPGWILLFPLASGLIVERGSLLSHSAIIAREIGLPAVVSVAGATRWIKDGDLIEVDGGAGVVRKLPPESAA